jgi:uncharacterized membrane protein YeaQ/YmgE (transglycosylase-associated protein family)
MEWLILVAMGAALGAFARFIMIFNSGIKLSFCLMMGTFGAVAGGVLYGLHPTTLFGAHSFYLMGALVSFALLVGGLLAMTLTHREKRV